MNKARKSIEFSLYVLVSIAALLYVSVKFWTPIPSGAYSIILLYLFLLVFIDSFPIKLGDIYISFLLAVSLAVFLEYGLVVELWVSQLAILISSLVSDQRRSIPRLVLSQMMFIWVSIAAGLVFIYVGGKNGVIYFEDQMIPIMLYAVTYFLVNHTMLLFIRRKLHNHHESIISEDLIWDAATLLLTVPLGVILYVVKISYGIYGMLFVAIPIIIVTQLFKIYSELHHSHRQLKGLNKLSSSFTSELNYEKTISSLQSAIRELLNYDFCYIFLTCGDKLKIISIEDHNGKMMDPKEFEDFSMTIGEGLSGRVALYKKSEMVGSDADLYELEEEPYYIKNNKSLLSVPMIWHDQVIGVITLGSTVEYHFSKKDLTITKILASQAAVAIQNATRYQKTEEKSLMDELTGVHNYRAFDELIKDMVLEAEMKEEKLSLLMIDLDHFKKVNDRYGHSAGNVVLKEIAKLLKEYTRKEDIVARYGGEEFIVIIPNSDTIKAKAVAERIRSAIENVNIKIKNDLDKNEDLIINVTASIGVATYPDMAESPQDIIRHADRAMYIGSKQAGRNRVSVYSAG